MDASRPIYHADKFLACAGAWDFTRIAFMKRVKKKQIAADRTIFLVSYHSFCVMAVKSFFALICTILGNAIFLLKSLPFDTLSVARLAAACAEFAVFCISFSVNIYLKEKISLPSVPRVLCVSGYKASTFL